MIKETFPIVILVIFGIVTLVQLLYYYGLFSFFAFSKKRKRSVVQQVPISVIMVVKDAASVLMKTLPRYLSQQYPEFEVVVVDDNSNDETCLLIKEYQTQYQNLKLVDLESAKTTIRGRKFAISVGIRCAKYNHLIFTDAECVPTSSHWLERMASHFDGQKKIVLGYSTYSKRKNPFNRLLHFDTLQNAMELFSLARVNSTYRGDGRNLGYAKELFTAQRGFASHNHIAYGEEDIFISRAAKRNNTAIEISEESFTVLQHGANRHYWKDHKEGLYFTRKFNTLRNRILLGGYEISNLLFYLVAAVTITLLAKNLIFLCIALGILLVRIISQYLVFGFAASKLNEKQVIPFLLLYDLLFALLNPLYYIGAHIHHKRFL